MTNDLVKRLRSQFSIDQVRDNPTFVASTYEEERDEAADRIEQLEAALRLMLDNDRNLHRPLEELFAEFCIEARAALGEKKDGD